MSETAVPTFRDFASHIFSGDLDSATGVLSVLLGCPAERARVAAAFFKEKTLDPSFLPRAMSLRTAVTQADEGATVALLVDCFGLDEAEARGAARALKARYA